MSSVTCHVLHVTCHVSHITCHLSLTPTATATDPLPAKSPIIHSRLDNKTQEANKIFKTQKIIKKYYGRPLLAMCPLTKGLQSTGKWVFRDGTDTHTDKQQTHIVGRRLNLLRTLHPQPYCSFGPVLNAICPLFRLKQNAAKKNSINFPKNHSSIN